VKGKTRRVYRILVLIPLGKQVPGSPWRRWKDKIKMAVAEIGCEDRR
jgi:hypothetical protein